MEYKIASRTCRDGTGPIRHFHYYLIVDQVDSPGFGCEHYGVRIKEASGPEAAIPAITTSATEMDELMTTLVDNLVGPVGLADVIEDWQSQPQPTTSCLSQYGQIKVSLP